MAEPDGERLSLSRKLKDFCTYADENGKEIWSGGKEGVLCTMDDYHQCPLNHWARNQGGVSSVVSNCVFGNQTYSIYAMREAYRLIERYEDENPEWRKRIIGKPKHDNDEGQCEVHV